MIDETGESVAWDGKRGRRDHIAAFKQVWMVTNL